jgi:hypothetical protein
MLTSITPLGERGRGHRYWLTRSWLLAGHVVGGLALGAVLAIVSLLFDAAVGRPTPSVALVVIAAATAVAVIGDLAGLTVPGRRQVDERWLTTYRGWVYGVGFGAQLGFGLVTVVNTLLLGVVLVAGVVLPPGQTLALGAVYGLIRGIGATRSGRVRTVNDLRALHRRLDRSEPVVRFTSLGAAAVVALGSAVLA